MKREMARSVMMQWPFRPLLETIKPSSDRLRSLQQFPAQCRQISGSTIAHAPSIREALLVRRRRPSLFDLYQCMGCAASILDGQSCLERL